VSKHSLIQFNSIYFSSTLKVWFYTVSHRLFIGHHYHNTNISTIDSLRRYSSSNRNTTALPDTIDDFSPSPDIINLTHIRNQTHQS